MRRWLAVITTTMVAALSLAPVATAAANPVDPPDLARKCSVDIDLEYNGTPITGAPITIYLVANMQANGPYLALTPDYTGSGADLTNINTADDNQQIAQTLLDWAQTNHLAGQTTRTDNTGQANYTDLTAGLYLVAPGLARGYYPMTPYLILLPQQGENNTWVYDVTAEPKTQPMPASAPITPTPTPTGGGANTGGTTQTGPAALVWAAILLTTAGVSAIAAKRHTKQANHHA